MKFGQIIFGAAALCAIIGGVFTASQLLATDGELDKLSGQVQLVAERLDKKILSDRLKALEERVWKYDDKYGRECERCPAEALDTYRRLKQEMREIERELSGKGIVDA